VNAFATRDELRVRYSELLTPLLRRAEQRESMIAEARRIGEEQQARAAGDGPMLAPATVLARLREAAVPRVREDGREVAVMVGGARVGRVRPGKSGGVAVDLSVGEEADLDQVFAGLREAILGARAVV